VSHEVLTLTYAQALRSFFVSSARGPGFYAAFFAFLPAVIPGNGTTCGGASPFWPNVDSNASFAVRDFSQCDIGMTHSGSELDERTMPEGELADTP
jgi:hypothetical protein